MPMLFADQKVYKHFLHLSPKLRMLIIDKMEPAERCRFTRCSKLCYQEAKSSKNYIYEIELIISYHDRIYLYAIFDKDEETYETQGYVIKFRSKNGMKYMKCSDSEEENELWRHTLDNSIDLLQFAIYYFTNTLKPHQNTIKSLKFYSRTSLDCDLNGWTNEIESLNSLEILSIDGSMNPACYFPKLRKPLKEFNVGSGEFEQSLLAREELYQVERSFSTGQIKLTNEQWRRLGARDVCIPIGDITENQVFLFIRSWQNGTLGKDVRRYVWFLLDSNFDLNKLQRLLRYKGSEEQEGVNFKVEIRHYKDAEKIAILQYFDEFGQHLSFEVLRL